MNASTVISVNPSQKTAGTLHPEMTARFLRRRIMADRYSANRNMMRRRVDAFFGVTAVSNSSVSARLVWGRILFAAFTAVCVLTSQFGTLPEWGVTGCCILCGLLTLGCFQRIAMGIGAIGFMANVAIHASVMQFSPLALICGLICIWFAVTGAGMYSIDAHMRHRIYRKMSRHNHRRAVVRRMSYRAYTYR